MKIFGHHGHREHHNTHHNTHSMHMARRKMSHVIDELYTAMFRAGAKDVDLHLSKEERGLRLRVTSDYLPEHRRDLERMAEMLQPELRNPALVEAYWELAGGDQYTSDSEMNLVGQMLDDAKVSIGDDQVEMEFFLSF